MRHAEPDVVIIGAGIAGGALGTVLASAGFEAALLERENSYPDRVRGEFLAPWGVTELAKLELLQPLREAGALFTRRNIPYDENFAPAEAEARALDLTKMHAEGLGGLCLGHPATCDIFAQLASSISSIRRRCAVPTAKHPCNRHTQQQSQQPQSSTRAMAACQPHN
jgi:2-polyprenyl-6-methoxyphenol hydroxylase-like FAD-dependent oxidoreductase